MQKTRKLNDIFVPQIVNFRRKEGPEFFVRFFNFVFYVIILFILFLFLFILSLFSSFFFLLSLFSSSLLSLLISLSLLFHHHPRKKYHKYHYPYQPHHNPYHPPPYYYHHNFHHPFHDPHYHPHRPPQDIQHPYRHNWISLSTKTIQFKGLPDLQKIWQNRFKTIANFILNGMRYKFFFFKLVKKCLRALPKRSLESNQNGLFQKAEKSLAFCQTRHKAKSVFLAPPWQLLMVHILVYKSAFWISWFDFM